MLVEGVGLLAQVRQEPLSAGNCPHATYNTAVAARLGEARVSLRASTLAMARVDLLRALSPQLAVQCTITAALVPAIAPAAAGTALALLPERGAGSTLHAWRRALAAWPGGKWPLVGVEAAADNAARVIAAARRAG